MEDYEPAHISLSQAEAGLPPGQSVKLLQGIKKNPQVYHMPVGLW